MHPARRSRNRKSIRNPGTQEPSKAFRGFLASLWNFFWLRLGRVAPFCGYKIVKPFYFRNSLFPDQRHLTASGK
jgi:hypothetical protein